MIKSLLGADEPIEKEETKPDKSLDTSLTAPFQSMESADSADSESSRQSPSVAEEDNVSRAVEPFEIAEPIGKPKTSETPNVSVDQTDRKEDLLELEIPVSYETPLLVSEEKKETESVAIPPEVDEKNHVLRKEFIPDSVNETIRKTGLASSAAIVLFASVAFMMLIGWFADFIFGTQPWGIVGGIVVGAVIGFVQFFRTTAQILRPPKSEINKIPVYSRQDDDSTE